MKTPSTLLSAIGGIFFAAGCALVFNSGYNSPSIPAGFLFAFLFVVGGVATIVSGLSLVFHRKITKKYPYIFQCILGVLLLSLGVRTLILHPLELPPCPCASGFYGEDCAPCDCVNGICDDGSQGSGICSCDLGWGGSRCDVCAPTFTGDCTSCARGWTGAACDRCYPGYVGSQCNQCHTNWISESDDLGTLCRTCKPGFYGGYCTRCGNCQEHDDLAVCRDNAWHDTNVYTGSTCTSSGQTCVDKYDCSTFNCKGICVDGDETLAEVCESNNDCSFGTCQFKTCCAEERHGNGQCECRRQGFTGPLCEPCPGFDGIYSSSVCGGHGTCAAVYSGSGEEEIYNNLQCVCNTEGDQPFPSWSGDTCGCLIDSPGGKCTSCADGYFGESCLTCPGGGGISQCSMHGECEDGLSGSGICSCDIDIKPNGLGGWGGEKCSDCFSSDFYGSKCQVCPLTTSVKCGDGRAEIPGTGICINSCGTKTCTSTGSCIA